MTGSSESLDSLAAAVKALLRGDDAAGRRALTPVAWRPEALAAARPAPRRLQIEVFRRDNFTCRYCGRRTLFPPVLPLLSARFPDLIPIHPNWKRDSTHPLVWDLTASADHITPRSRGGSGDAANLATACYRCQDIKGHWLLDELRWTLLPASVEPWDGLSSLFDEAVRANIVTGTFFVSWHRDLVHATR